MSDYLVKSKLEDTEWQIKSDARDHSFICDVSDDKYNAGPNPVEYLCGSINSCIEISAGMINKKSIILVLKIFVLKIKLKQKN